MRVIGHGVDIVDIARVALQLDRRRGDVPGAWFTAGEVDQAPTDPGRTAYFAGRIAAKEAVAKALGTGLVGEMAWTDIEILRLASGAPSVALSGAAADAAGVLGVSDWLVSISHSEVCAVASVIAVGHDAGATSADRDA